MIDGSHLRLSIFGASTVLLECRYLEIEMMKCYTGRYQKAEKKVKQRKVNTLDLIRKYCRSDRHPFIYISLCNKAAIYPVILEVYVLRPCLTLHILSTPIRHPGSGPSFSAARSNISVIKMRHSMRHSMTRQHARNSKFGEANLDQ